MEQSIKEEITITDKQLEKATKQVDKICFFAKSIDLRDAEEVKEITGYGANERYFLSNYGDKVYSICFNKYRELKICEYKKSHRKYITIQAGKKRKKVQLHLLVADTFLTNPYKDQEGKVKIEVHHKDFDKTNNRWDNLEYLTKAEHDKIHALHRKELREQKKKECEAGKENGRKERL